jgi:hypothetical protein
VIGPLSTALLVAALALAAVALVHVALDRSPGTLPLGALGVLEVALVAQLVVGVVLLATDDQSTSAVVFVGYLVGILLILPAGVLWSLAERSRSGTAVLVLACLTVAFLVLRLGQLWDA